ncbi:MAG: hypothetical protein M1491_05285 [Deltaproteobacteria bacterium]|nr:hypothetical protein [Deltaproteobacteria bacterium]
MAILRTIATRLAHTKYGREAVESKADLGLFGKPPSFQFVLGLILLGLSYVIGWPGVVATGIAATYLKNPLIFVIGAPVIYGFSYLVWGVSMILMGRDNIKYVRALTRYGVRIFIEKFVSLPHCENRPSSCSSGSPSRRSNDREYPPSP